MQRSAKTTPGAAGPLTSQTGQTGQTGPTSPTDSTGPASLTNLASPTSQTRPLKTVLKRQAEVFKALGHPGRMAIVHALGTGAVCACDLAAAAGCAASTTSRHLTVLRQARLIHDERRGQQIFYHLSCPCVLTFAECINRVDAGEAVQTLQVACCA